MAGTILGNIFRVFMAWVIAGYMNVCVESIPCAWKSDKAIDNFKLYTWLQCNLQLKEHGFLVFFLSDSLNET